MNTCSYTFKDGHQCYKPCDALNIISDKCAVHRRQVSFSSCVKCLKNFTRRDNGLCTTCDIKPKPKKLKQFLLTDNEIQIILQIRNAARPASPYSASSSDEDI